MKNLQQQVVEFHKAMGQPILDRPTVPDDDRVRLRAALVAEEALEFVEALFEGQSLTGIYVEDGQTDEEGVNVTAAMRMQRIKRDLKKIIDRAVVKVDLPKAIDALTDIDYVVAGSYLEFGVDSQPIAAEVHRANMSKANGPRAPNGKVMKPEGFRPPDIERESWSFSFGRPTGASGRSSSRCGTPFTSRNRKRRSNRRRSTGRNLTSDDRVRPAAAYSRRANKSRTRAATNSGVMSSARPRAQSRELR